MNPIKWSLIAIVALLTVYLLSQLRRPSGWLGRRVLADMNRRHSDVTDWGLSHVAIGPRDTILDIGCGGGRTLEKLAAAAPEGRIFGVDFSPTSVAASQAHNAATVASGRMRIQHAGVSKLPFEDRTFDLVTAVETHFYWPNLARDVAEIARVLKPGGRLCVIAEIPGSGKLLRAFGSAGLAEVQASTEGAWTCVTGRRPVSVPDAGPVATGVVEEVRA